MSCYEKASESNEDEQQHGDDPADVFQFQHKGFLPSVYFRRKRTGVFVRAILRVRIACMRALVRAGRGERGWGARVGRRRTPGRVFALVIIRTAFFSGAGARSYGRSIELPGGPVDRSARSGFEAHPLSVYKGCLSGRACLPLSERLPAGVRVSARLVHA